MLACGAFGLLGVCSPGRSWAQETATAAPPIEPVQEVLVVGDAVRDPVAAKDTGVPSSVLSHERLSAPGLEASDVLRNILFGRKQR